jgi:hypothetical protein
MPKLTAENLTALTAVLAGAGVRLNQIHNADVLGHAQAAADHQAKSGDLHLVSKKLGPYGRIWDIAEQLAPKTHQDVREISDDLATYVPDGVHPNQTVSFLENQDGKVIPNPNTGE